MLRIMTMMMIMKMMMVMMRRRMTTRMIMTMLIMMMIFFEFAMVTQHRKRGWNRTSVPIDINPFITNPTQPIKGCTTTPGSTPLTLYEQQCGFFYVAQESEQRKSFEMGPTVFRPYPRWLECLTICRCHNKGCTFSSVILRPWVLVQMGFEPATSHSAYCRLSNCANRAAVMMMMMMMRRRRRRRRRRMMMLMMMILTFMMITMTMRKMTLMMIIMLALFIITIKATKTLKNKLLRIEHTTCPLIY